MAKLLTWLLIINVVGVVVAALWLSGLLRWFRGLLRPVQCEATKPEPVGYSYCMKRRGHWGKHRTYGGVLFLLPLLVAGCPERYSRVLDGHWPSKEWRVADGRTQATLTKCGYPEDMKAAIGRVWPLVLEEWERAVPGSRVQVESWWLSTACLIEEPEPCALVPQNCAGNTTVVCARKRGCVHSPQQLWVARWWPPVCTAAWPTEPHCVPATAARSAKFYCDFGHEGVELVNKRLNLEQQEHGPLVVKITTAVCARLGGGR